MYVAVSLNKSVFEKLKDKLTKQGETEEEKDTYKFQEGEIDNGDSQVRNVDVDEDYLQVSVDFGTKIDKLGNIYLALSLDDFDWDALLKFRGLIDGKLVKIGEAIKGLIK